MQRRDITDKVVVDACRQWRSKGFSDALECIAVTHSAPAKVCMRAMERAESRGLIEYGVSLRMAWPVNDSMG